MKGLSARLFFEMQFVYLIERIFAKSKTFIIFHNIINIIK